MAVNLFVVPTAEAQISERATPNKALSVNPAAKDNRSEVTKPKTVQSRDIPASISRDHRGYVSQEITVGQRQANEYASKGFEYGPWNIKPAISTAVRYSDNIYAKDDFKESDVITQTAGTVDLTYNRPDFNFTKIRAKAERNFYQDNTDENNNDFQLTALTQQTIKRGTTVLLKGQARRSVEGRKTEAQVTLTEKPVDVTYYEIGAGFNHKPARVGLMGLVEWERHQHGNSSFRNGGGAIIQDDRDRDVLTFTGEVSYDIDRVYEAFVRGTYGQSSYMRRDYLTSSNQYNGTKRDSDLYEIMTGVRFDISSLISADLGVGYLEQEFDDPSIGNIDTISTKARLAWNVTPITTFKFNLERGVRETVLAGSPGYVSSMAGAAIEHELKRNILLTASTEYSVNDYEALNREDDILSFSLGALYKLNRSLGIGLEYRYDDQDSTDNRQDFGRNIIMVRLRYNF